MQIKETLSILSLILFSLTCNSQDNKLDLPFETLLKELHADFKIPDGFEKTTVNKKLPVFYQYAIKHIASGFEVRYFLKPYNRILKDYNVKEFDPRDHTYSLFLTTIANSAAEPTTIPKIDVFTKEDIKKDFNADWGATTAYKPNILFGSQANFSAALVIKKDDVGEIYVFWLFTDVKNQEALMMKSFSNIKFK
jgi:hypothetical protein